MTSSEVITSDLGLVNVFPGEATKVLQDSELLSDRKLNDCRILVVEDNRDTQELLKTVLERHGAIVTAVDSSATAFEAIARAKPDVIISDAVILSLTFQQETADSAHSD